MGRARARAAMSCSSSSTESSSSNLQLRRRRRSLLSTDLRLGLGVSSPDERAMDVDDYDGSDHDQACGVMRRGVEVEEEEGQSATFYVKVYMEGIPIGRKLDLLALHGYHALIHTLDYMFNTNIIWSEMDGSAAAYAETCHVLTYEDREGDWMMVGDVPWEMFLSTVRRLKITRAM